MLRLVIAFAAAAACAEAARCPEGYQLMGGGRCIRPYELWIKGPLTSLLPDALDKCAEDKAHLPIIKSDQDNQMFNDIVAAFPEVTDKAVFLVLGMVCNPKTRRLEWQDGTPINYIKSPPAPNLNFDCVDNENHVVSRVKFNDWFVVPDDATFYTYTFLCETVAANKHLDELCGEYDTMSATKDLDKPCIKIFTEPLTWKDAEKKCEEDFAELATINSDEENNFIRRAANGLLVAGGMHIGAYESPEGSDKWLWVDGGVPIGKNVYGNFVDSFPIPGDGSCTAMNTQSTAALWVNVNCTKDVLPFVCRRVKYPSPQKACPEESPMEGVDFFPPNFPHPNVPCEYILTVADKKLVQLEVVDLEANVGADYLEIYEGAGGAPITNLTGTTPVPPGNMIKTVKANLMRVNWNPKGAIGVRGFRLRYTAVDP